MVPLLVIEETPTSPTHRFASARPHRVGRAAEHGIAGWIAIGLGSWLLVGYLIARAFGMAAKGAFFSVDEETDPADELEPGRKEPARLSD